MIARDLETAIETLQRLIDDASVVVPFTGAGISTECGIPDFRSPGGVWTKMAPIPFDEFLASEAMRAAQVPDAVAADAGAVSASVRSAMRQPLVFTRGKTSVRLAMRAQLSARMKH